MAKIALGMSGGVDSSVAVHLLQEAGWEVQGIHLQLTEGDAEEADRAAKDAQAVADHFGIPLAVIEARDAFRRLVTDPFIAAYRRGETPNPCVRCNRLIKFGQLWRLAQELGCSHLATGHYARLAEIDGETALCRGPGKKDQSYFLYGIDRAVLPSLVFPLGAFEKTETRALAASLGLAVAQKKDSQDICFIPDNDYAHWLEGNAPALAGGGAFVDPEGRTLGQHQGAWRYTIGQRKGLGIALGYPAYVTAIDAEAGRVTVAGDEALWHNGLAAHELNWLTDLPAEGEAMAQIRSRDQGHPCRYRIADGGLELHFETPVRAITPGQSVVLYDGDRVLGGGLIRHHLDLA